MAQLTEFEAGVHSEAIIHDGAHIDPTASIAEGAIIEPGAVVGPRVSIGPRTRVRRCAIVVQDSFIGADNDIHPHAVLGGDPQDLKYKPEAPGRLIVGDRNTFRESVTVHRSVQPGPDTVIGNGNFFMACSHAGHNVRVGDNNTLANGVMFAGHSHIGNRCVFGGGAVVHQFCTVGDGVMFRGLSGVGMHVPPYSVVGAVNTIVGLNTIGMRRNPSLTGEDREQIKRAFRALFRLRGARPLRPMVVELLDEPGSTEASRGFLRFILERLDDAPPRARGIVGTRRRSIGERDDEA
ncbi:MAG: acyl-ACP--UDP-N-acetylglucosamine O-acyltransferase [Phycisphaerales bacterium]